MSIFQTKLFAKMRHFKQRLQNVNNFKDRIKLEGFLQCCFEK